MRTKNISHLLIARAGLLLIIMSLAACDLIDPSKIENPQITAENLLENPNGGTTALVTGLRRYFSATVGVTAFIGDIVSDNLDNRTSFYANELSFPRTIKSGTFTYDDVYIQAMRLRAIADFGVSTIIPNDILSTSEQKAEVHYTGDKEMQGRLCQVLSLPDRC